MSTDNHLAYGDYHGGDGSGERGLFGDTFSKLKSHEGVSSIVNKFKGLGGNIFGGPAGDKPTLESGRSEHRYGSFAGSREGNDVKWYVDGCSYFWAVSVALEQARETIWILDWWLSPELYLRRPPMRNEQYRLDRMLLAAAQRGVKINIIVYKEVEQALTRKYLSPLFPDYLKRLLPASPDKFWSSVAHVGLGAALAALEAIEAEDPLIPPPLTVNSIHTKHALEALHPHIAVFRHPDHIPDARTLESSLISSFKHLSVGADTLVTLPEDAIKGIFGMSEDVVLYWAHHEKLCLIDGQIGFMGGLDMCYGRWDTWQHSISDVHPQDLQDIVFPGQDYNNARVMDFQNVADWQNNKVDRTKSSRMGWSDLSFGLRGPVIADLEAHFVQRWNFIYNLKYDVRRETRYAPISRSGIEAGTFGHHRPGYSPEPEQFGGAGGSRPGEGAYFPSSSSSPRQSPHRHQGDHIRKWEGEAEGEIEHLEHKMHKHHDESMRFAQRTLPKQGSVACQLTRSAAKWSNGTPTEHSIQNAYCSVIRSSQHFVYIENQFFITATSNKQEPVQNQIGAAIVERILRAAQNGEKYKVIVVIPSIPGFAGDLKDDSSLGTRAIMEFQYNSINRGGCSIMEEIGHAGVNPTDYIRFYNLRNYDRINYNPHVQQIEKETGVDYESARRKADEMVDSAGYESQDGVFRNTAPATAEQFQRYQKTASQELRHDNQWDSVADCYMLGGKDIRDVPWEGSPETEMNAFVSEELYIHTKLLIADDRIVICGSANLNDRSQLGFHDSEIAMVMEDLDPISSFMNGRPWRASKFAATLRRQLFRKHLGLVRSQNITRPDQNFAPIGVPNEYDYGSPEDHLVQDPLAENFLNFWNSRARRNTDAFGRIFHPVPHDAVRNWSDYQTWYEKYFREVKEEAGGTREKKPAKYEYGHVVAEEFANGEQGLREMKDLLSTVKGTLIEMPLMFLVEEDIAKEGLTLNALTEVVYT